MVRRFFRLFVVVMVPMLCVGSTFPDGLRVLPVSAGAEAGSDRIFTGKINLLNFAPLEEADTEMQCASAQPPKALATPHPALAAIPDNVKITVNFIIGVDGEVYSPFVLASGGASLDRKVVETVRRWRYQPALCNGVPTDAEVKVQLSSR